MEIDIDELIHEVIVPTCSYRMGVREMAFGLASIDLQNGDERILYTNLWLPRRFPLLYAYIAAGAISLLLFAISPWLLFLPISPFLSLFPTQYHSASPLAPS